MQLREREIKFVLWHCLGIQIIYLIDIRWNREREREICQMVTHKCDSQI